MDLALSNNVSRRDAIHPATTASTPHSKRSTKTPRSNNSKIGAANHRPNPTTFWPTRPRLSIGRIRTGGERAAILDVAIAYLARIEEVENEDIFYANAVWHIINNNYKTVRKETGELTYL